MGAQDDYNEAWEAGAKDAAERCALLAEGLAAIHEASAARIRREGTFTYGWFGRKKRVAPAWERAAKDMEAAAHGLRTIARGCRAGWDPRKCEPDPNEKIEVNPAAVWKPCSRCSVPMDCASWCSCERGLL